MEEKAMELLEKLATKMGVGVDLVWAAYLKQAKIACIVDVAEIAVSLVVIFALLYVCNRISGSKMELYDGQTINRFELIDRVAMWGICTVVVLIIGTFLLATVEDAITAYFNPEFWAFNKIIGGIKK